MNSILQKITTGWSIIRLLYLSIGIFLIISSLEIHQWLGVMIGGYSAAMGVFGFGCASRACYTGNRSTKNIQNDSFNEQKVEFEEINSFNND